MKVVSGFTVIALLCGCGGRSGLERTVAGASGGDVDHAPGGPVGSEDGSGQGSGTGTDGAVKTSSVGLDIGALAAERCVDFALPATEPRFVTQVSDTNAFPRFGACGHLTLASAAPTPIWEPDLGLLVAAAQHVSFSPEGSRAIFVPAAPEDDRVRRLDLLTMQAFDTPVAHALEAETNASNFGLFVNAAGDVESWVCDGGKLQLFADRAPSERPVLEVTVPSCMPAWTNDATLLWQAGANVEVVDLRAHEHHEQALPAFDGSDGGGLLPALDGYAAARMATSSANFATGPLYSLRDGSLLATTWENVPPVGGTNAANSLDGELALLIDDGSNVTRVPGMRGLYVFRDKQRAFGFVQNPWGTAELVYLDLAAGEKTSLLEFSALVLDPTNFVTPTFAVSPGERAAYFVVQPALTTPAPDQASVVRWVDGNVELLRDAVPFEVVAPAVADDGTAVFIQGFPASSLRVRPGAEARAFPTMVGLDLSRDGTADLASVPVSDSTSELVVTNLDSGAAAAVVSDLSWLTETSDFFHQRHAVVIGKSGATAHELWAGRFPGAPRITE